MTDEQAIERKAACEHERKTFLYTVEDWIDGDEDDVYRCDDCGARVVIYIPR